MLIAIEISQEKHFNVYFALKEQSESSDEDI